MKLKVLGCTPVRRELYMLAANSPHDITVELFEPNAGKELVQQAINSAESFDYIVLAVGECLANGLCAENIPIAAARVHNCAHLLLGSRERFIRAFCENEDSPHWLNCESCRRAGSRRGAPCYIGSKALFAPLPKLPEGTREYISDLSLLAALLNGDWDNNDIVIVKAGERIVADSVDILDIEPI